MNLKRALAALATIALMGLLLWSGVRRPAPSGTRSSEPSTAESREPTHGASARLDALLESAVAGDVDRYLASFDGPLRDRLTREVNERGRQAFADDLREATRARKSHAVFAVEPEGEGVARITVETVYTDRNDRQTYHLTQGPGGWLVTDVETLRGHVPKARYGAPANFQDPEGVPVQSGGLAIETGDAPPSSNPSLELGGSK